MARQAPPHSDAPGSTEPPFAAKRRHVTFLFADLVGSSALSERLDPESFHALIDRWLQAMTVEVERFGGTLNQFSGDGILVLFGAPLAQEDAPVQACRAALALQRRVAELDGEVKLALRIGVDSGEIVAGVVGTDRRGEYAALGQRTNRAKRVQENADPGSILISHDTQELVREYFRLLPAGEFAAKGFTEPVLGYRLLAEKEAGGVSRLAATMARWHAPLVGRAAEVERLERAIADVANGRPRTLALRGDAGIGKSRLLYELAERARAAGFTVCEGRSEPLRRHVPYAPYIDILRQLCGLPPAATTESMVNVLEARYPDAAPYLRDLVSPAASPGDAIIDSNTRMLATRAAWQRVLRTAADSGPLLLALDDMHACDPLSRELTEAIASGGCGALLLCVAARGGDEPPDPTTAETLRLRPFDGEEIRTLLVTLDGLGEAELSRLAHWLERQSGGVPLFVEEIVLALQADGALRRDESGWHLSPDFRREHVPGSLQDLLAARIERMAPAELRALQVAAIVGAEQRTDEVAVLAEGDATIAAALAQLQSSGILLWDDTSAQWRFRSTLTRMVAYNTIPTREREALHRRLAEAIERGELAPVDDPVLADHFRRGGRCDRAIALLRRAAARAEWAFANHDAVALLDDMLHIGGDAMDHAERAEALIQRGRVRTAFLGDTAGLDDLEAAVELSAGRGDLECRALLAMGTALYRQFRFDDSLVWLERAEREANEANLVEPHIEALLQRAFVLSEIGISVDTSARGDLAAQCCERALALSRRHGNARLEAQSLNSLGTAYLQQLDYDRALATFEQCLSAARAVRDRGTEALALQSIARSHQFRFDFERAGATIATLQTLLRELGDRRRLAFSTFNMVGVHLGRGDMEAARRAAEEALPQATELGLGYLQKLVLRSLIGFYSGEERRDARIAAARELLALLTADGERADRVDVLIDLAAAEAEAGASDDARAHLAEAAKLDIDLANFARAEASLKRLRALSPTK